MTHDSLYLRTTFLKLDEAQQERALLRFESDAGLRLLTAKLTDFRRELDADYLGHARRHVRSIRRDIKHRTLIRQPVAEQREVLGYALRSKRFFEAQRKSVCRLLFALRMERRRRKRGGKRGAGDWI